MSEKIVLRKGLLVDLVPLDTGELAFATDSCDIYVGTDTGNAVVGTGVFVSPDLVDCSDQIVTGNETHFVFGTPARSVVAILNGSILSPTEFTLDVDGMGVSAIVSLNDVLLFLRIVVSE